MRDVNVTPEHVTDVSALTNQQIMEEIVDRAKNWNNIGGALFHKLVDEALRRMKLEEAE